MWCLPRARADRKLRCLPRARADIPDQVGWQLGALSGGAPDVVCFRTFERAPEAANATRRGLRPFACVTRARATGVSIARSRARRRRRLRVVVRRDGEDRLGEELRLGFAAPKRRQSPAAGFIARGSVECGVVPRPDPRLATRRRRRLGARCAGGESIPVVTMSPTPSACLGLTDDDEWAEVSSDAARLRVRV